jgi:uncharacterized DUF497 family protein
MARPVYHFEWDPTKAGLNRRKHGISFEEAAEVFRDPAALSLYDGRQADREDRWVTLGRDRAERLVVVVHTFVESAPDQYRVRLISARKASRGERRTYETRR